MHKLHNKKKYYSTRNSDMNELQILKKTELEGIFLSELIIKLMDIKFSWYILRMNISSMEVNSKMFTKNIYGREVCSTKTYPWPNMLLVEGEVLFGLC